MILANQIAEKRKILSKPIKDEIWEKMLFPLLKVKLKFEYLKGNTIIEAMKRDKKRTSEGLALIMLNDEYQFESVKDLSVKDVEKAICELCEMLTEKQMREI